MENFRVRLSYFLRFGYIHGIRYLGQRCGPFGKIYWSIVLISSAVLMGWFLRLTLESFRHDVVDVNIDTAYLHWTNTFPSVAICLGRGSGLGDLTSLAHEYFDQRKAEKPKDFYKYVKTLQDYVFLSPSNTLRSFKFCETAENDCGVDIEYFRRRLLPTHCSQFMLNVSYLGQPINDCATIFEYTVTEIGICFVANGLNTYNLDVKRLPLIYDRSDAERKLDIFYNSLQSSHYNLYVLSPEQLPYVNSVPIILVDKGSHYQYLYNTIEVTNTADIRSTPISVRQCRFPNEPMAADSRNGYSISSCFTDMRISIEMALCNCTMPSTVVFHPANTLAICDYVGLRCLAETNIMKLTKLMHFDGSHNCVQSCVEMEIEQVGSRYTNNDPDGDPAARLTIGVQNVPTLRYRRRVAKTLLDAVVAVGGVVGLFFGASALSVVECVYIWCVRRRNAHN